MNSAPLAPGKQGALQRDWARSKSQLTQINALLWLLLLQGTGQFVLSTFQVSFLHKGVGFVT